MTPSPPLPIVLTFAFPLYAGRLYFELRNAHKENRP
jgi:hypothetical protein